MTEIERKEAQLRPILKTYLLEGIIRGDVRCLIREFVNKYIGKKASFGYECNGGRLTIMIEQTDWKTNDSPSYKKLEFDFIILE